MNISRALLLSVFMVAPVVAADNSTPTAAPTNQASSSTDAAIPAPQPTDTPNTSNVGQSTDTSNVVQPTETTGQKIVGEVKDGAKVVVADAEGFFSKAKGMAAAVIAAPFIVPGYIADKSYLNTIIGKTGLLSTDNSAKLGTTLVAAVAAYLAYQAYVMYTADDVADDIDTDEFFVGENN